MRIQIAYADVTGVHLSEHDVQQGCSAGQVIKSSGVLEKFPAIDLQRNKVGIFSKVIELDAIIHDGDRIEIYEPVQVDPKQARRNRAKDSEQKGKA